MDAVNVPIYSIFYSVYQNILSLKCGFHSVNVHLNIVMLMQIFLQFHTKYGAQLDILPGTIPIS